jgi:hypothetical protein
LPDEYSLLDDYSSLHGVVAQALKDRDARSALDSLGHEVAPEWETPNPNNRPIWGLGLQRARLTNFAIWLTGDEDAHNAIFTLMDGRVMTRPVILYLGYQMQRRAEIATKRVEAERSLREVAVPTGKVIKSIEELRGPIAQMRNLTALSMPVFNRLDPARPSDDVMRGIEALSTYVAQFEPGKPVFYTSVIGTATKGTADELGKASGLGAFAVIVHGLAGKTFKEEELDQLIASIASQALRMRVDHRAVFHRRDVYLKARGQEIIRRRSPKKT